jgi:hypothetical protein
MTRSASRSVPGDPGDRGIPGVKLSPIAPFPPIFLIHWNLRGGFVLFSL